MTSNRGRYLIPVHTFVSADEIRGWNKTGFEMAILSQLSRLGVLRNISRLNLLLVSNEMGELLWKEVIPQMRSLLKLDITVVERMAV